MAGEQVLSMAAAIEPRSLQLTGRTVRWTEGGQPKAASLGSGG
jgi:hypothetical protein